MMLPYKLKPTWVKSMHSLLFLILLFYYLCHKRFFFSFWPLLWVKGLKFHNLLLQVFTRALRVSKYPLPLTLEYSLSEAARRTDGIFSRSSGERRHAWSEWGREENDAGLEGYVRSCLGAKLIANTFSHLGLKDIASPCECLFIWMLGRCYFGQLHE